MSKITAVRPVSSSTPDVASAQQQQQLAQALYSRAIQGNPVPTGGPVQAKYGAGNALVDIAGALAGAYGLKQANDQVTGAKRAESQHLADAISQYRQSVPDQAVGAASRAAMAGPMEADGLPASVVPRSDATSNLAAAAGPDAQRGLALALMQQGMAAPDTKYQDLGDRIAVITNGQLSGYLPKGATPDSRLSSGVTMRGQDLTAGTAARGQDITLRGQDVAAGTARRGQDISAATTTRGQDITADTARRTDANGKPKAPTEYDRKAQLLFGEMRDAAAQYDAAGGTDTSSKWNSAMNTNPVTRVLTGDDFRKHEAAGLRWAQNFLYLKSGQSAPVEEVRKTMVQYMPQPGDGPDVKAQKAQAREQAMANVASANNIPWDPQATRQQAADAQTFNELAPIMQRYLQPGPR